MYNHHYHWYGVSEAKRQPPRQREPQFRKGEGKREEMRVPGFGVEIQRTRIRKYEHIGGVVLFSLFAPLSILFGVAWAFGGWVVV